MNLRNPPIYRGRMSIEHRRRLSKDFKTSPSLKGYFLEEFAQAYIDARESASTETGMDINLFPFKSPFTPEQVLDKDYLPEA